MSTTEVLGMQSRYVQPTLGLSTLNKKEQLRPLITGLHRTISNSKTNLFVSNLNARSVESAFPTNPMNYDTSIELHSKLASIFVKYDIKTINSKFIADYLKLDGKALALLNWLPSSIKAIFGQDVEVALGSLIPIEPGDPILEVKIASELPLNEEFDRKEKDLFKNIDDLSLATALGVIVITYA